MKTHRTDGLSLTFGLVFLVITVWWLTAQAVNLSVPNAGWFVAGTLIVLGVLGLVGALRAGRGGPLTDGGPVTGPPDTGTATPEAAAAPQEAAVTPQGAEVAPPDAAAAAQEPAATSVDTTVDLPTTVDEPRGVGRE
jgi:hypothetical protein